jgi:hypothetical protein
MMLLADSFKISLICFMFCVLGEPDHIFAWYQRQICKLPELLCKPFGGCMYCFTGQVSLWYFIITKPFNIIELLFFVSLSIFLTKIYLILWNYE